MQKTKKEVSSWLGIKNFDILPSPLFPCSSRGSGTLSDPFSSFPDRKESISHCPVELVEAVEAVPSH